MENTTKGYEIPDSEFFSPEQATSTLKRITADVTGNPQHPYVNKMHPQHKDFSAAVTKLYEVKGEGKLHPIEQACNDALAEQEDTKYNRAVKTAGVLVEMESQGFSDKPELTKDTPVWKQDIWKMQSTQGKGNHQLLKNEINSHIINSRRSGLKIPFEMQEKISVYGMSKDESTADKANQDALSQEILEFLATAHGEQDRRIAKALKPSGNFRYVPNCY